jgi:thiamine-monophosphate kinase
MNGGEDYELLFTIQPGDIDKLRNHPDVTMIGRIREKEEGVYLISKAGNKHPLQAQGWKAF